MSAAEGVLERGRQGVFFAEPQRPVEVGEGDVRMVEAGFRVFLGEAAAGHAGGQLCLETEEIWGTAWISGWRG